MSEQPPSFEDESLKAAVQRAWGKESAPPALHRRIEALIATGQMPGMQSQSQSQPAQVQRPSRMSLRPRWYPIAAAIVCLLGVGWLSYQLYDMYGPKPRPTFTLPAAYADAMARRHDEAVASPTTGPAMAQQDLDALKDQLQKQVEHPVAAVALGDDWVLKSARATEIDGRKAAQLLFAKKDSPDTTASLFSVPLYHPYNPPDGAEYNQAVDGHMLAGFVHNDMIYCLLVKAPDGRTVIRQLEPVRQQLESTCH